jgi:nitroreductase/NAD-dependent dihydropyrimidine dehydrogenase PreA subunit
MKLIVDQTKCKKDGICAETCPNSIIGLSDENGFPRITPGLEMLCISCGHCVAVCPHGALSHPNVPVEDCPPIKKELAIGWDQAAQFLRARRSIRIFKDTPVDKEVIQKLIDIACHAPTGGNSQLVRWIAVADKAKVHALSGLTIEWMRGKLAETPYRFGYPPEFLKLVISRWGEGHDPILRKAPALVLAKSPKLTATDPTLALSYFELAATALGLGTCWAGLLRAALLENQPLREAMQLKDDGSVFYYPMMVGYPKFSYHLLPKRKPAKIQWI